MLKEISIKLGIVIFVLAGCTPAQPTTPDIVPTVKLCAAKDFQFLKWQPKSVLNTTKLPKFTRIIEHGSTVTMDYVPSRLNISVGKLERIERIYCG